MKAILLASAALAAASGAVSAQEREVEYTALGRHIRVDPALTAQLADTQEGLTQDVAFLLRARQSGRIDANTLTLGGFFKGAYFHETTDTAGKFPILNRFPDQHGSGEENSDFVINAAGLTFTGAVGDWLTGFVHTEYSEVTFTRDQNQFQTREYYAVLGNLDVFGGYLAYGRKTIDFGEQFGYNPFTHSINQHFFWALADEPVLEVGYIADTWRVSATAATGERMLRVGFTTDRDGGLGTNYALKAERRFDLGDDRALRVSASYLHDTIYNNNFTAHTVQAVDRFSPPNAPRPPLVYIEYRTGLWDIAAEYTTPRYDLAVEYTRSTDVWSATSFNTDTGQAFDGNRHLDALTVMGRYRTELLGYDTDLSAVFSHTTLGPDNTEFDEAFQHVLGLEMHLTPQLDLGVEYVFNDGFQPFVGIQDVSLSGVQSNVGIVGIKARF